MELLLFFRSGSQWSILAFTSALALVMTALNWTPDVGFNLAWNVCIMIRKFLFRVILFLVLPHIRNAFVKYHILPEPHVDLVLIFSYQYEVRIVELIDLIYRKLAVTFVNHSIYHVQGFKLLRSAASMSMTAALRSTSLPAATVAFGLFGIRRD